MVPLSPVVCEAVPRNEVGHRLTRGASHGSKIGYSLTALKEDNGAAKVMETKMRRSSR